MVVPNSESPPPLALSDVEGANWSSVADVVVIGFGGAGACAALQARESGAQVIAIDRFDGGGSTALSGGVYYGCDTEFQRASGFHDSPQNMYNYLQLEVNEVVSNETLRRFCDENRLNLEWLISKGIHFDGSFDPAKTSYPLPGRYLYYSGNEKRAEAKAHATPAPRGHRAYGGAKDGFTGTILFDALRRAAIAEGVRILTHCPAERLVTDGRGEVVGVQVRSIDESLERRRHAKLYSRARPMNPFGVATTVRRIAAIESFERTSGEQKLIRARRGVVLATGGFIQNRSMLSRHAPRYLEALAQAAISDDGSGIRMGQSVGGRVDRMSRINLTQSITPPEAYVKGVLVNVRGERFVGEDIYTGRLGYLLAEQQNGRAWLIIDRAIRQEAIRQSIPSHKNNLFKWFGLPTLLNLFLKNQSAPTLEELAKKCGINGSALVTTMRRYEQDIETGERDLFGKEDIYRQRFQPGRRYAVPVAMNNTLSPGLAFTLGGLVVDEKTGAVRRTGGNLVGGLFAAGRTAVGLPSENYVSGLSIADAVFSGRRAGDAAARRQGESIIGTKDGLARSCGDRRR
jgi:3-oxo-5alpha-steroid 4-dehydrogenase